MRLLEKDPARRPASADEALAELEALATPDTVAVDGRGRRLTSRTLVLGGALVAAAIAVAAYVGYTQVARRAVGARRRHSGAPPARRRQPVRQRVRDRHACRSDGRCRRLDARDALAEDQSADRLHVAARGGARVPHRVRRLDRLDGARGDADGEGARSARIRPLPVRARWAPPSAAGRRAQRRCRTCASTCSARIHRTAAWCTSPAAAPRYRCRGSAPSPRSCCPTSTWTGTRSRTRSTGGSCRLAATRTIRCGTCPSSGTDGRSRARRRVGCSWIAPASRVPRGGREETFRAGRIRSLSAG